ncbi:MAG: hypothetical protein IPJ71_11130 [Bdellovibrionales bacterium]|nr:hypothetical protein [Bdellovibrionales bacterium]
MVIVEPSLKEGFKRAMLKKLLGKKGKFSLGNTKIGYYLADETLDDVEIADEMGAIQGRESSGGAGKGFFCLNPACYLPMRWQLALLSKLKGITSGEVMNLRR